MDVREQVDAWVRRWIVGERICPFAKPVVDNDRVYIAVSQTRDILEMAQALAAELARLDDISPEVLETTLLVLPNAPAAFNGFLDWLDIAHMVLDNEGWSGIYQVVAFHPDFRYSGDAPGDPGNWTNRSPVPLFHLLREASIARAIVGVEEAEAISDRNRNHTTSLGVEGCRRVAWGETTP